MSRRKMLGVLGGMGGLASAELMATLYRLHAGDREQEGPVAALYSDPSMPDRTAAILGGSEEAAAEIAGRLGEALDKLLGLGAERLVIACVTAHHFLPRLPEATRERVISLLDLVVEEVAAARRPVLLLSTTGTRRCGVFERHPGWQRAAPWVGFLEAEDQERLHARLYRLKAGEPPEALLPWLAELLAVYGREGFIFGCTELHLLRRPLAAGTAPWPSPPPLIVDPLFTVAHDLERWLGG